MNAIPDRTQIPMVQINIEDVDKYSEAEFEKVFEALPTLGKVALMEDGECKGVLMDIKLYERYKDLGLLE